MIAAVAAFSLMDALLKLWCAILVGLVGVLTMLRPSASGLVTLGAPQRSDRMAIDRVVWHVLPSPRVCLGRYGDRRWSVSHLARAEAHRGELMQQPWK